MAGEEIERKVTGGNVNPNETLAETSSSLLERLKENDQQAWERFVHLYSPLVYRWCRQNGLQEADAADVGQEVFRAVAHAIGDYHHDQERDTFRGWLRTITWNKMRDFARRTRDDKGAGGSEALDRLLQLPAETTPESDAASVEDENMVVFRRALELVLAEYEEHTRQAFLRVVMDEQVPADVAKELNMTLNAVYLAKSRILRRIREEFAGLLVQ